MKTDPSTPRPPIPLAVRRMRWWFLVPPAFVLAMYAAFVVVGQWEASRRVADPAWMPPKWVVFGIPSLYAPVMVVMFIGLTRGMRRVRRMVQATGGLACTGCLYDMRGAAAGEPGQGAVRCPECGRAFDPDMAKASWRRASML